MRTNIVLDDQLVEEAQALSHIKTKRELIDKALREFIANRKQLMCSTKYLFISRCPPPIKDILRINSSYL